MPHEHSARRRGPIHRARILTSSNMCFHITKYTYPIRQIPAFISSNTYLTIIKHTHSFHRTRISPPPFRERLRICGHDKSGPYSCERSATMLRTNCNIHTYTHEMPHEHSARRRGRFIAPVSLHKQIHISALPNICIHIITHTYPHHQTRAFISSNTYIHITAHAFPFLISWVFTYMRAR